MAGDWIKMRVLLARDPAVIRMADFLATSREFMNWLTDPVQRVCKETAYEHVTCNVISALCVTGLLVTWGVARDRGDRVGDDLVLDKCSLATLTEVSGIPDFGEAMADVKWAVEDGNDRVRFPKFFKQNESPEDRYRRANAERQAKFRRKRNVTNNDKSNATGNGTHNVTVTHREEKRRSKPPVVPRGFERFWKAWPPGDRKEAKGKCCELWVRQCFETVADAIVAHVETMKASEQWRSGFVPAPLVFLNQRRWEGAEAATEEPRRVAV